MCRRADIYLLNDPLNAVDPAVSRHIFEKYTYCFASYSIMINYKVCPWTIGRKVCYISNTSNTISSTV